MSTSRMAELTPSVIDALEWSNEITPYDQQHFITYARLLDAEAENADWRDVARVVLQLDPDKDPERSQRCWHTHLDRAKWIATTGYQQLVDQVARNQE